MAISGRHSPNKVRAARMTDMANPGMGMWVQPTPEHTPEFAVISPNSIAWNEDPSASAYSVVASPSLGTATVSGTTCTFSSSMSAGTEYTFTVTATGGTDFSFKGYYQAYSGASSNGSLYAIIPGAVTYSSMDLVITANGAAAGANVSDSTGTRGGRIVAKWVGVPTYQYLYMYVGGKGGNYCRNTYTDTTCSAITNEGVGGWNGGGSGGSNGGAYQGVGAAGGGATDIRTGGTALSNRILVAGGAGAYTSTLNDFGRGGFADGETGRSIGSNGALGGGGGTSLAGGAGGARSGYSGGNGGAGSLGSGGNGGNCPMSWCMGGNAGGGGYYGGGGGESGDDGINNTAAGGGGGSGFMDTSTFVSTTFLDSLNGLGLGSDSNGNILLAWQESSFV